MSPFSADLFAGDVYILVVLFPLGVIQPVDALIVGHHGQLCPHQVLDKR